MGDEAYETNRQAVREIVWDRLREVALPDSRFDLNFDEFIPDFVGSEQATERVTSLEEYRRSRVIFVTPDNCLTSLRSRCVRDNKILIVSTYGIRRGFVLLRREDVPPGQELYAAWLDGLEHFGRPIRLRDLREFGDLNLLVTGASAVNSEGLRFGKGHGYFDVEVGIFTSIGTMNENTPVIAVVHDCQVVDVPMEPGPTDTVVDRIVTSNRDILTGGNLPRPSGIRWDLLPAEMLATIPPLQELQGSWGRQASAASTSVARRAQR
jgi:5-formyltetrahydrofolate cyclo-ligase